LLGWRLQQCSCSVGVTDGGLLVQAEHGGEVERIWPEGGCLVELSVDA